MESTSSTLALPSVGVVLEGDLQLPQEGDPQGLVVFVHGSGSSRFSSRNRSVAAALRRRSLATLLFDLLTAAEEQRDRHDASLRFDIPLLAERLIGVLDALAARPALRQLPGSLPIGLFGASTGAAAALIGAAERPERVGAVVSRGGRPDLAAAALPLVRCPTLLLVGGHDSQVLALNRRAAARLAAPHHLEVVAGASHLFEEAGCLERVAELAGDWFVNHLGPG
jgi:pimeloyl-ACP methyl ester carboxylesterase